MFKIVADSPLDLLHGSGKFRQEVLLISKPLRSSLFGWFAFSRSPMDVIWKFFFSLGLKGECFIGLLDTNHILIWPILEYDYIRLFVHHTWFIQSSPMTISKWTLDFKASQESSVMPIRGCFPELPIPFFQSWVCCQIGFCVEMFFAGGFCYMWFEMSSSSRVLVELMLLRLQ